MLDSSSAASAPRSSSAATVPASSRSVSVSCARPLVRLGVVDAQHAHPRARDLDRHAEIGRDAGRPASASASGAPCANVCAVSSSQALVAGDGRGDDHRRVR